MYAWKMSLTQALINSVLKFLSRKTLGPGSGNEITHRSGAEASAEHRRYIALGHQVGQRKCILASLRGYKDEYAGHGP